MAKASASKLKEKEKQAEPASPVSLDEAVGQGLTPKKESSSEKKDYAQHPKFAKFNSQGSETP